MKRRITLSIALVLGIVLSALTGSDSRVSAQQTRIRVIADTGVVTLGANQKLRLSIVFDDTDGAESVAFRRIVYAPGNCSGGICKSAVASQTTTAPVMMMPGEAALFDMIDPQGQVRVLSNSRNARVAISIIDSVTGEIVSYQNEYAGGASGDL
jgi:hypothetical protein